jgi:hypothetical protein
VFRAGSQFGTFDNGLQAMTPFVFNTVKFGLQTKQLPFWLQDSQFGTEHDWHVLVEGMNVCGGVQVRHFKPVLSQVAQFVGHALLQTKIRFSKKKVLNIIC